MIQKKPRITHKRDAAAAALKYGRQVGSDAAHVVRLMMEIYEVHAEAREAFRTARDLLRRKVWIVTVRDAASGAFNHAQTLLETSKTAQVTSAAHLRKYSVNPEAAKLANAFDACVANLEVLKKLLKVAVFSREPAELEAAYTAGLA